MNLLREYIRGLLTEKKRVPRKKGQHRNSPSHSDLFTDENPKGTIKGLKFATVKDAEASVNKIKRSGKSHAHKTQAAIAMEQRAKSMGKKSAAAVYRKFINQQKEKTSKKNEAVTEVSNEYGWSAGDKKGFMLDDEGMEKSDKDNIERYLKALGIMK